MRVRSQRLVGNPSTKSERTALVRDYIAEFQSPKAISESALAQQVARGKQLYEKHCSTCHNPNKSGVAIGASLDNLTNRTDEALVTAILDPNSAVEPKYKSYFVQLDDGKTLVGVIESEVADNLTLAHADGKRTTIRRGEIEIIKSTGTSLMPEGFESTLSPADLQALVRFLQR